MRPLPRLRSVAEKAREGTLKVHVYLESIRVLQTLFVILHLLVDSINILFLMHKAKYMGKPLVIPDALILLHRFNSI